VEPSERLCSHSIAQANRRNVTPAVMQRVVQRVVQPVELLRLAKKLVNRFDEENFTCGLTIFSSASFSSL
jgi:hypothetical protein